MLEKENRERGRGKRFCQKENAKGAQRESRKKGCVNGRAGDADERLKAKRGRREVLKGKREEKNEQGVQRERRKQGLAWGDERRGGRRKRKAARREISEKTLNGVRGWPFEKRCRTDSEARTARFSKKAARNKKFEKFKIR